jgi:hypothetical protein
VHRGTLIAMRQLCEGCGRMPPRREYTLTHTHCAHCHHRNFHATPQHRGTTVLSRMAATDRAMRAHAIAPFPQAGTNCINR